MSANVFPFFAAVKRLFAKCCQKLAKVDSHSCRIGVQNVKSNERPSEENIEENAYAHTLDRVVANAYACLDGTSCKIKRKNSTKLGHIYVSLVKKSGKSDASEASTS
jgi:hypothetical protein